MPCSGSTIQRYTKDTTSPPTTTTTTYPSSSSSSSLANHYPCHNGGTCLPLISPIDGSLSSSCKCKPGYTGNHCQLVSGENFCSKENNPCIKDTICASLPENQGYSCFCTSDDNSLNLCLNAQRKTENAFIPDFSSTSYLTLPTLTNIAQTFIIEIWFYSRDPDGLLFYNGQQSINSRGDFISLNLVNRFVQFSYNLGSINPHESGLVTLKSDDKISIGKWHSIRITRNRKQGSLQLDSLAMVYGEAKTNLSELNLDQPFYIGSIPPINSLTTHRELNLTKGFNGAIQRIVVNGDVWDDLLDRSIEIYNIAKYSGPPCESPNPCSSSSSSSSSNSICVPQFNDYFCKCNHFGDYNENSCDSNEK
ncbi:agrin-like [Panonychus citri]|uniref:agrin-like n=1 Tax=Panonychus citri TaxID=50023 RepID=UPI002307DA9D|nr:agrin-like [Panonychus citri]